MKNCIVLFLFLFGWCYSILSQPQYTFKRLTMSDGMVSNYIVDIIQDKQGYIWMASESGLCKFDGKDFTIYNIGNSAIGSNAQNVLYYNEADNTVWVGTQRDGISIFDCEKQTFITNGVPDMITRDVTDLSPAADVLSCQAGDLVSAQTFRHKSGNPCMILPKIFSENFRRTHFERGISNPMSNEMD